VTTEERIAHLEAELARERARADGLQEIVHALTVKRRSSGAERQARYRERHPVALGVTGDATVTGNTPSPSSPFPSPFPPSPDPSSPYPLSFPPSSPPPVSPPSSAAPREELRLEPQQAARRATPKKTKPEKPTDPRHAPLTQDLVAAGWTHHGGRTAKAVADLLALANQHCLVHGGDVPGEVKRRAAIAMAHEGFPRVREIHELVPNWGHFAEVPRRAGGGPAPPSSWDLSKELPPPSPEDDTVPL
jgi:hypothetical protein